jgi:hypothetical protein
MNAEMRLFIGNIFIVLSRVVLFVGAGIQALGILWLAIAALCVFFGDGQPGTPVAAVVFYFIGRWHQRRLTKRTVKSNKSSQ